MILRRVGLTVVSALMCGIAAAQGRVTLSSAQLTGALLQNHPYLLDAASRTALDEINRNLRETEQQLRKRDATPEEKTKATAAQTDAEKRLVALLDKITGVVRVSFVEQKPVLVPAGPFTLPGDTGALLFRVESGAGESHFAVRPLNFSETENLAVPVEETGVTWVLFGLSRVPRGRTTTAMIFMRGDTKLGTALIDLLTPEQGRLKVTVQASDSDQPLPAMVRLLWKTDGQVRKPGNGIDFNPQFDHQGNTTRVANLPGKLHGEYWCVPGPIDMALPAGEWEVTIRRGGEHVPVIDTLTVSPGQTVEKSYKPRRWVDMRKLGWYSGDDHVHCQILSNADARRLMAWAKAEDVHLCNIVKMGDINRTWFEQRGFGKTYRVVDGDYVLSPGQECPRTHDELGHTIAMNISSMIRDTDRYYLYDWVFDQVHAQGGLSGYAHVGGDLFHVHRDMSVNVPKDKIDFVEVLQFFLLGTDVYYEFLNTGFKVTASAGSDVPWGGSIGEVRVYALTGPDTFDADKWFDAVKRGHTFVTDGPMLEFTVDQAVPGDQLDVKDNKPLHVKARVWGDPEASLPSKLDIVRNGEVIKTVAPTDPKQAELKLEFDVEPSNGFWIAARAEGADGTRAHTTPIYVVKPGLRFWKFEDIDNLIAKRLASLDEIEALVKDRTDKNARGEIDTNRAQKQLALQGPELLKRVAAARQIYEDLKKTVEKERPLRTPVK